MYDVKVQLSLLSMRVWLKYVLRYLVIIQFISHYCYHMNMINILPIFALCLLQPTMQNSVSPVLSKNPYFSSGRHSITLLGFLPPLFQDHFYTSPLPHTVVNIDKVYYSTAEMIAQTLMPYYPGTLNNFIWYEVSAADYSNTYLTTKISGFFQTPFFSQFTFSYLLILANNPFIPNYAVLDQIEFTPTITSIDTPFPAQFQPSHALDYAYLIKQIKKIYVYGDMDNFDFDYWIKLTHTRSIPAQMLTASIDLPPYVNSFANYSVTYLVIIIDRTAATQAYPKYVSRALMITVSDQSYITFAGLPNTANPDSNLVFGLTDYYFFNRFEPSFSFDLSLTNSTATFNFYGDISYRSSTFFTYSYLKFAYYDCNSTYFIYNQTQHRCHDICLSSSQYFNVSTASCLPCSQYCETCYDSYNCNTCFNSTFRELVNFQCVPIAGYFESFQNISGKCSSNCLACQAAATNCTACRPSVEILINNTCYPCTYLTEGCQICTQTSCLSYLNGYRFINQTFCNLPCADPHCLACSNTNNAICYKCINAKFGLINSACVEVRSAACGDGMISTSGEQCDDGNRANHDGCSSICKVQTYYSCTTKTSVLGFNYTFYCSYTHPIDFTLNSVEKINYSNQLKLILSVSQFQQSLWNTPSSLNNIFVETPIPYKNMRVEFINRGQAHSHGPSQKLASTRASNHPQSSLLAVYFEYLQSIHHKKVRLSFNFTTSLDHSLSLIPPSSIELIVQPDNNHHALLYSQKTYSRQQILSNIYVGLSIAGIALLIVSYLIGCKRIPAEMLMIFQVAYASLLTVPKISPLFSSLTSLSVATNGFNVLYSSEIRLFQDTLIDNRTKGAILYSQFLYNFNLAILFFVIPIIAGISAKIIRKIVSFEEKMDKKIIKFGELALGQFVFVGLIFEGCIIGVSSVLEFKFGMREISSFLGAVSLMMPIIMVLLYVAYNFIRIRKNTAFEQYKSIIVKNTSSIGLIFQLAYFNLGILMGVLLTLFNTLKFINIILAFLPMCLLVATWSKPIFNKNSDKSRTQLNLLTLVFIQIPFLYANLVEKQTYSSDDDLSLLMPMSVGLLLLLNFAGNFIYFAYEIVKLIRRYLQQTEKPSLNEQYESEKIKELNKNHINILEASISTPMFVKGFIEYSQKDIEEQIEMEDFKLLKRRRQQLLNKCQTHKTRNIFNETALDSKISKQKTPIIYEEREQQ